MFSPHFYISEVDPVQIQAALRCSFKRWGLPRSIKVDNGKPLGDLQRTSVPELALWLIGLGIEMIWNPLHSPRCNAKVERMQATTARWAEPTTCCSVEQLQTRLNQAALLQRERYKPRRLGGKSRKQLFAALWTNPRHYHHNSFDINKVYHYLSTVSFKRKVNNGGGLTFYAQYIYAGVAHKAQSVSICFNKRKKHFQVLDEAATVVGYFLADNFTQKPICTLNVCQHRTVKCQNFVAPTSAKT